MRLFLLLAVAIQALEDFEDVPVSDFIIDVKAGPPAGKDAFVCH